MSSVSIGQLWSVMDAFRPRYTLRVTRIDGGRVQGTLAGGKLASIDRSVLMRGRRGAYLVEHADGRSAPLPKHHSGSPLKTLEDTRTASDYKPPKGPRGIARAGELQRAALAMREAGVSFKDVCEHFGKNRGTMSAWLLRAREQREDERNLKAVG